MGIVSGLRNFWRAFRTTGSQEPHRHSGHSVARTVKESTQIAGSPGMGRAGTEAQHEIAAKGHEAYSKSVEKDN